MSGYKLVFFRRFICLHPFSPLLYVLAGLRRLLFLCYFERTAARLPPSPFQSLLWLSVHPRAQHNLNSLT